MRNELFSEVVNASLSQGPPRGTRNPAFTQDFRTNHAHELPEIHVHAKFIQSRWMPDSRFTKYNAYLYPIPVFSP